MIAHICRLSLRHKSSIQAKPYRLPYARSSYGSLTYLRQKLRRCLQLFLPRKKRLLQLCPDITGRLALHCWSVQASSEGLYSGALYPDPRTGSMVPLGQNGTDGTTYMNFKASRSNAYFGSSSVTVPAAYCLIIIKA